MESKAALVWPQGRVELHSVSPIDLHLALVVLPDDAELNDSFGDGGDLEGGLVLGVLLEEGGVLEGGDELCGKQRSAIDVTSDVGSKATCPCTPARTRARRED